MRKQTYVEAERVVEDTRTFELQGDAVALVISDDVAELILPADDDGNEIETAQGNFLSAILTRYSEDREWRKELAAWWAKRNQ